MQTSLFSLTKIVAIAAIVLAAGMAQAATMTYKMVETFDDATINPLLTNWNSTPINGGMAHLNGVDTTGLAQGFTIDLGTDNTAVAAGGPNVSYVIEAIIGSMTAPANLDTLLTFNGANALYFNTTPNPDQWQFDCGNSPNATLVKLIGATPFTTGDHVALVFTWTGGVSGHAGIEECYVNGVNPWGNLAGKGNSTLINQAGWGLQTHSSVPISRGFNGDLDAISYSTFTGTFDPLTDFALYPTIVPEPSSVVLVLSGLIGLLCYAWKKRK